MRRYDNISSACVSDSCLLYDNLNLIQCNVGYHNITSRRLYFCRSWSKTRSNSFTNIIDFYFSLLLSSIVCFYVDDVKVNFSKSVIKSHKTCYIYMHIQLRTMTNTYLIHMYINSSWMELPTSCPFDLNGPDLCVCWRSLSLATD